jgi:hypothetical protein
VKARSLTGGVDNVLAGRFRSSSGVRRNLALIGDYQGSTLAAMKWDDGREPDASYYTRDPYGGAVGASGQYGDRVYRGLDAQRERRICLSPESLV